MAPVYIQNREEKKATLMGTFPFVASPLRPPMTSESKDITLSTEANALVRDFMEEHIRSSEDILRCRSRVTRTIDSTRTLPGGVRQRYLYKPVPLPSYMDRDKQAISRITAGDARECVLATCNPMCARIFDKTENPRCMYCRLCQISISRNGDIDIGGCPALFMPVDFFEQTFVNARPSHRYKYGYPALYKFESRHTQVSAKSSGTGRKYKFIKIQSYIRSFESTVIRTGDQVAMVFVERQETEFTRRCFASNVTQKEVKVAVCPSCKLLKSTDHPCGNCTVASTDA